MSELTPRRCNPNAVVQYGKYGHVLTYDGVGNRTSDTYLASPLPGAAVVAETYEYDTGGRLKHTRRDNWIIDMRKYDDAGRLVQSGAATYTYSGGVETSYKAALRSYGMDTNFRTMAYDAAGRLLRQKERDVDGTPGTDVKYMLENHASMDAVGYDRAGRLKGYYVVPAHSPVSEILYTVTYVGFDSFRQAKVTATGTQSVGSTVSEYDQNGFLTRVSQAAIGTQAATERTFVNDASGRALQAKSGSEVMYSMIVNGEVLGSTGGAGGDATPGIFGSTYEPSRVAVNSSAPFVYVVQSSDETLQSIAQSVWGDSKLWYLIADANGGVQQVVTGMALQMPARVNTVHNDYQTYKPYDPSRMVGDTTPALPSPTPDKGCGTTGLVIVLVIAIVVTVLSKGATSEWLAQTFAMFAEGGVTGAAAVANGAAVAVGSVVGAVAGSVVSQGVAMMIGQQDEFSWKAVGLAALSAGVNGGVAATGINNIAASAIGNALTQQIAVALNLQDHFDWRGVVAAAAGSYAGEAVGGALKDANFAQDYGKFAANAVQSFAAGATTALFRGGKVSIVQVAADAFGNALGSSLAESMSDDSSLAATLRNREDPYDTPEGRRLLSNIAQRQKGQDLAFVSVPESGFALPATNPEPLGLNGLVVRSELDEFTDSGYRQEDDRLRRVAIAKTERASAAGLRAFGNAVDFSVSRDINAALSSGHADGFGFYSVLASPAQVGNQTRKLLPASQMGQSPFVGSTGAHPEGPVSTVGGFNYRGDSLNAAQFDISRSWLADAGRAPINFFANTVEFIGNNLNLSLTMPGHTDYISFMDGIKQPYSTAAGEYFEFGLGLTAGGVTSRTRVGAPGANSSGAKLSFDSSLNTVDRAWSVQAGEMLASDPVARASYARLQRQGTDVKFVNDPNMREMGLFDPYSNEVTVNMLRHSSAREAGSTVVHEALHQNRFFRSGVAPGTQFEEYLAFRNEFLFQNARRPTLMERQQIINDVVKPLYPHLPSGKLPTFGGGKP